MAVKTVVQDRVDILIGEAFAAVVEAEKIQAASGVKNDRYWHLIDAHTALLKAKINYRAAKAARDA